MLCQFTFKNVTSYRGETTLTFSDAARGECLLRDGAEVSEVPGAVVAVCGPSGAGTSAALEALSALILLVVKPLLALDGEELRRRGSLPVLPIRPFAFDEQSKHQPTELGLVLRCEGIEYRYELAWSDGSIAREALFRGESGAAGRQTLLFERRGNEALLGNMPADLRIPEDRVLPRRIPLLACLAAWCDNAEIDALVHWFMSCRFNHVGVCFYHSCGLSPCEQDELLGSPKEAQRLVSYLDAGIEGVCIANGNVVVRRRVGASVHELSLEEESSGVRAALRLVPSVLASLRAGGLVVADGLGERLPPEHMKRIAALFRDPRCNVGGGQLLLSARDERHLYEAAFRREELWRAEKDSVGVSALRHWDGAGCE